MKPGAIFTFLFYISSNLYSQPPEIKEIFFGLPLDSSRSVVCKTIRANKIFTENFFIDIVYDSGHYVLKEIIYDSSHYAGLISDISQPADQADSAWIYVESKGGYKKKYRKNRKDTLDKNLFTISYYYSSYKAMLLKYENYLNKIRPLAKDSMDVEDEGEIMVTGTCYFLKKRKNLPQIQIAWQDGVTGGYFFSVTYIRE